MFEQRCCDPQCSLINWCAVARGGAEEWKCEDIPKGTGVVSRDSVTRRGTEICPHLFHGFASVGEKFQLQIIVFSRIW